MPDGTQTAQLLTAEDFARIAPILGECELVNGEIVRMPPGGVEHNTVVGQIFILLQTWNRRAKAGRALTNETGVVVRTDPDSVRGADVLFISYQRLPAHEKWKGFLRHRPELVVEVLAEDESWKRMEEKVADYHAFGVDLVWVADPQTETVRAYPKGRRPKLCSAGAPLDAGKLLPGFTCEVAEFFKP